MNPFLYNYYLLRFSTKRFMALGAALTAAIGSAGNYVYTKYNQPPEVKATRRVPSFAPGPTLREELEVVASCRTVRVLVALSVTVPTALYCGYRWYCGRSVSKKDEDTAFGLRTVGQALDRVTNSFRSSGRVETTATADLQAKLAAKHAEHEKARSRKTGKKEKARQRK